MKMLRRSSLSTTITSLSSSIQIIRSLAVMSLHQAMKPKEVMNELDKHIVGQYDAKRAVAIALRNRWRRHQLSDDLKNEVIPKNILMIGPTGNPTITITTTTITTITDTNNRLWQD